VFILFSRTLPSVSALPGRPVAAQQTGQDGLSLKQSLALLTKLSTAVREKGGLSFARCLIVHSN
jgi:hypothetical protein